MSERYKTIVADPPWPQKGAGPLRGREGFGDALCAASKSMPYRTMTIDEIANLPIRDQIDRDAHLYLWTTNKFLEDAFLVMRCWGFKYSTTLVWAKRPMGGGLGGCYGLATEYVLFGRRGKLQAMRRIGRNHFDWKRPYDERGKPKHSAKPSGFFAMVEQVSPGPYLELFARQKRIGWHSWGDEVPSDIRLIA